MGPKRVWILPECFAKFSSEKSLLVRSKTIWTIPYVAAKYLSIKKAITGFLLLRLVQRIKSVIAEKQN